MRKNPVLQKMKNQKTKKHKMPPTLWDLICFVATRSSRNRSLSCVFGKSQKS
jgi:hypothetical protein